MSMQNEFLKALENNEDDTNTRLVYADWLDEHGQHEEADRQRKWPAAKEWLLRFCEVNNDSEDEYEWVISYDTLLDLGQSAMEEESLSFSCGNNEAMCDALRHNRDEFWQNVSTLTGIPLSDDEQERGHFSCSC